MGVYVINSHVNAFWLENCENFTPTQERNDQQYSANPLLVQYKQQANPLLSMNNYTSLVISWKDKNKQLTLLSQCKLALTVRNSLFCYEIIEATKNFLTKCPVRYLGLKLTIHAIKSQIHLVRQSL